MSDTISLIEALKLIDLKDANGNALPFNISFRTLQRNSKTGGRLVQLDSAKLLTPATKRKSISEKLIIQNLQEEPRFKKNPKHYENRTRNLVKANGEIVKVHIRLIVSINNHNVVY
jgi:hypothetical protein